MLGIGSTTSSIYTALGTTLARENEEELEKKLLVLVYNQTKSVILSSCEMKKRLGIYLVSELKKWSWWVLCHTTWSYRKINPRRWYVKYNGVNNLTTGDLVLADIEGTAFSQEWRYLSIVENAYVFSSKYTPW